MNARPSNHSLRDLAEILFRHKKKSMSCFALFLLATVAAILIWPRTYKSEAKLFVRVGRETVSLDPTATIGQTQTVQRSQETDINTALDILGSHMIAEKVVAQLGEQKILNPLGKEPNWLVASISGVKDQLSTM